MRHWPSSMNLAITFSRPMSRARLTTFKQYLRRDVRCSLSAAALRPLVNLPSPITWSSVCSSVWKNHGLLSHCVSLLLLRELPCSWCHKLGNRSFHDGSLHCKRKELKACRLHQIVPQVPGGCAVTRGHVLQCTCRLLECLPSRNQPTLVSFFDRLKGCQFCCRRWSCLQPCHFFYFCVCWHFLFVTASGCKSVCLRRACNFLLVLFVILLRSACCVIGMTSSFFGDRKITGAVRNSIAHFLHSGGTVCFV